MFPMQGAWVQSLVRDLDPTCRNKDLVQPNKYFLFFFLSLSFSVTSYELFGQPSNRSMYFSLSKPVAAFPDHHQQYTHP